MRYACDYQEEPQALCSSSNRGAQVELLLQVSEPHLYFVVKLHDLICYWCEMWISKCWIFCEMMKVCVMMLLFWIVDATILFDSFTHIYLCFIHKMSWYSLFYVLKTLLDEKFKKK
jgi:hypothetical protein